MSRATGSCPTMDGTGVSKAHARFAISIAIGTVNVTADLLRKLLDCCISAARIQPVPAELLARYGPRIEFVHTALQACAYEPSTVRTYTHIVGDMLQWVDRQCDGKLSPENVADFLDNYVARGRNGAELRLGENSDETGRGVRYLTYHALKTVLDTLLGMELTDACTKPDHPPPAKPASTSATRKLFAIVQSDRELLLLVLTNGLKLRPSQTAALTWQCVSPDCRSAIVIKTKGVETVEINDSCGALLRSFREQSENRGFLFPSPRTDGATPLSVRTLQNILARMVQRAGIDERITLTSLRKAAAQIPPQICLPRDPETVCSAGKKACCTHSDCSDSQECQSEAGETAMRVSGHRCHVPSKPSQTGLEQLAVRHAPRLNNPVPGHDRPPSGRLRRPDHRIRLATDLFCGHLDAIIRRLCTGVSMAMRRALSGDDMSRALRRIARA